MIGSAPVPDYANTGPLNTYSRRSRVGRLTPACGGDPITESHVEGVWDEAAQVDYAVKFYRVTVARTRSNGVIVTR